MGVQAVRLRSSSKYNSDPVGKADYVESPGKVIKGVCFQSVPKIDTDELVE